MKDITKIMLGSVGTKVMLIFYALLSVGSGFLIIQGNEMLRGVFDNYLLTQVYGVFGFRLATTTSVFLLIFGVHILSEFLLQRFTWDGQARLAEHYMRGLLRSKFSFFTKEEPPKIWSDLTTATQGTAHLYQSLVSTFDTFVRFVFYGIVVFSVDFYAGLFTLVALPIYFLANWGAHKRFYPIQERRMKAMGELSVAANESFTDVANVKAKNSYDFFVGRINKSQQVTSRLMCNFNVLYAYISNISNLVSIIAPLLILFGAMQFSDTLTLDAGVVLVLYINIPLLLSSFQGFHNLYINYKSRKPLVEKLKSFADIPAEQSGSTTINTFESLSTYGVKVNFEGERNVTVPDFTIVKGEKVMFSGESGVGKSTIFNIVIGLIEDYEGDITINGVNLREIDKDSLREVFGIAFQSVNVMTLTLKENILLGIESDDINEIIKLTNLKTQLESKSEQTLNSKVLSGGEKSRLGLAQMLIRNPEVIFIDETFSSLDEEMEKQIITGVFEKYTDKTIICINHRSGSRAFFERVIEFN
ncbi:MAG: ABC transporter ATP-binding protein/permease [Defluviitaleaceae bacterium]|nr:ABC transporter ATP-binding protein/permease [Defluviitaleaceae bacterium]